MKRFNTFSLLAILALSTACGQASNPQASSSAAPAVPRGVLAPDVRKADLACEVDYVDPTYLEQYQKGTGPILITFDETDEGKPRIYARSHGRFRLSEVMIPQSDADVFKIDSAGWDVTERFNNIMDIKFQLDRKTGRVSYSSTDTRPEYHEVTTFVGICRVATADEVQDDLNRRGFGATPRKKSTHDRRMEIALHTPFNAGAGCGVIRSKLMEVAQEPTLSEQAWQSAYDQILDMAASHRCLEGQ